MVAMQRLFVVLAAVAYLLPCARAVGFRRSRGVAAVQEADTTCGKGFDNLVKGSQDYFATAAVELFTHPYHTQDNATFEQEFQCWFASMCTSRCGSLPSKASERKDKLTKTCKATEVDWLQVWKMFSQEEVEWFKKEF